MTFTPTHLDGDVSEFLRLFDAGSEIHLFTRRVEGYISAQPDPREGWAPEFDLKVFGPGTFMQTNQFLELMVREGRITREQMDTVTMPGHHRQRVAFDATYDNRALLAEWLGKDGVWVYSWDGGHGDVSDSSRRSFVTREGVVTLEPWLQEQEDERVESMRRAQERQALREEKAAVISEIANMAADTQRVPRELVEQVRELFDPVHGKPLCGETFFLHTGASEWSHLADDLHLGFDTNLVLVRIGPHVVKPSA